MQAEADQLLSFRAAKADKEAELTALESDISELASAVPQWAETLVILASQITSDECPVCLRDFSELEKGTLREFVQQRANLIGINAKRLQDCESSRAKLMLQMADVNRKIDALSTRSGERIPFNHLVASFSSLKGMAQRLEASRPSIDEWIKAANTVTQMRSEIRVLS